MVLFCCLWFCPSIVFISSLLSCQPVSFIMVVFVIEFLWTGIYFQFDKPILLCPKESETNLA